MGNYRLERTVSRIDFTCSVKNATTKNVIIKVRCDIARTRTRIFFLNIITFVLAPEAQSSIQELPSGEFNSGGEIIRGSCEF